MVETDDFWGHPFRAFGLPAGYEKGVWASGILRDKRIGGDVQIEDVKVPGYSVIQGFSGTPVWDQHLNGVVGMVVEADRQAGLKAAYIIPTPQLIRAWPPLRQSTSILSERLDTEHAEGRQNSFQPHVSTRRDFYAHIPLSPNYIERAEVLTHARTELLAGTPVVALTSAVQHIKPNALHGMGGIGKTVIARALCDDPLVQAAFPDSILWVTLGQEPELVTAMRELAYVLGGTISESVPTINSLKNILAKLLRDRACLLILDDVWRRSHVEAFLFVGPNCRLLLTTRDAEIAYELGAKVQPIPVMTQAEAISLLEEWADGRLSGHHPELCVLTKRLFKEVPLR